MRRIQHKLPYSHDHLIGALQLARQAYEVETGWRTLGIPPGRGIPRTPGTPPFHPSAIYRANVVGSLISSVACVEANINEFFSNAHDRIISPTSILTEDVLGNLGSKWEDQKVRRLPSLDKYQTALAAANLPALDAGRVPFQDVKLLIQLRNSMVHFKPQLQEAGAMDRKVETALRGKFETNPLATQKLFPYYLLSFSAARWAANATLKFVREFRLRIGEEFAPPKAIEQLEWLMSQ